MKVTFSHPVLEDPETGEIVPIEVEAHKEICPDCEGFGAVMAPDERYPENGCFTQKCPSCIGGMTTVYDLPAWLEKDLNDWDKEENEDRKYRQQERAATGA